MGKPKFTQFDNEEGTYTIVYDLNGKNETIIGVTGKRDVALNSVKELNKILLIERGKIKFTVTTSARLSACKLNQNHTKFQDVAHHYLGCRLIHKWSDRSEGELVTLDLHRLKLGVNDWLPVLREMNQMTEDEAIFIAKVALFNNYHGFIPRCQKYRDRWVVYPKSNIDGDKVEILFSGEICRWIEGKYSALPFEFSFELIPYLLKQGFDLFNLISNNEAVI